MARNPGPGWEDITEAYEDLQQSFTVMGDAEGYANSKVEDLALTCTLRMQQMWREQDLIQ